MTTSPTVVAVIMTVHNRIDQTLACLQSLLLSAPPDVRIKLYIVDDGSTDDTSSRLAHFHPEARIIEADGNLFWAAGMALAEQHALRENPDYILWLNNDILLTRLALRTLLSISSGCAIAVGAMSDTKGRTTYSGILRRGKSPTRLVPTPPNPGRVIAIDTFNGNLVLIPRSAYRAIGPIDAGFSHAYADSDYGLRAGTQNVPILLAPEHLGTCEQNQVAQPWRAANTTRSGRIKALFGRKGLPVGSQLRFIRRHASRAWPLHLAASYAKPIWQAVAANPKNTLADGDRFVSATLVPPAKH